MGDENGNITPIPAGISGQILVMSGFGPQWQNQTSPTTTCWGLSGNSGTTAGTNFIGTTDNNDVVFKRSNTVAGRIGSTNIAFGINANISNTTGTYNSSLGYNAMYLNQSGFNNTALGNFSMYSNVSGWDNTAVGYYALNNATGSYNTAIGKGALTNVTTGGNNTGIGDTAQVPNAAGSDQIRLGNIFVGYLGCQVGLSITSDRRWKSDIISSDLGLDFIKKLNPVSYFRSNDKLKKLEYGFIAQEIEETLTSFGITNSGILTKDDEGFYSMRYNDLIAPMTKAIQEQQKIIESQETKIQSLEERLKVLEEKLSK